MGLPTETFYGIAASVDAHAALERLAELKSRPVDSAFPLLLPDVDSMTSLARAEAISNVGIACLTERFWPGPLTLVLAALPDLHPVLVGPTGGVAMRLSSHPIALALAQRVGRPITATSANLRGEPPASDHRVLQTNATGRKLDFVIPGGKTPGSVASTVLELSGSRAVIHRAGAVPASDLASALRPLGIRLEGGD